MLTSGFAYQWETLDKKRIKLQRDSAEPETFLFNDSYMKAKCIDPDYQDPIYISNKNIKPKFDLVTSMKKVNSMMSTGSTKTIPEDDLQRILRLSLETAQQEQDLRERG